MKKKHSVPYIILCFLVLVLVIALGYWWNTKDMPSNTVSNLGLVFSEAVKKMQGTEDTDASTPVMQATLLSVQPIEGGYLSKFVLVVQTESPIENLNVRVNVTDSSRIEIAPRTYTGVDFENSPLQQDDHVSIDIPSAQGEYDLTLVTRTKQDITFVFSIQPPQPEQSDISNAASSAYAYPSLYISPLSNKRLTFEAYSTDGSNLTAANFTFDPYSGDVYYRSESGTPIHFLRIHQRSPGVSLADNLYGLRDYDGSGKHFSAEINESDFRRACDLYTWEIAGVLHAQLVPNSSSVWPALDRQAFGARDEQAFIHEYCGRNVYALIDNLLFEQLWYRDEGVPNPIIIAAETIVLH
jgi:hypothetical protein